MASAGRWNGTDTKDGSEVSDETTTRNAAQAPAATIARAQDQLFDAATGSRRKYAALVVGRPGLLALLAYEFVITLAQPRAGALGLALRKMLYPLLLGACGRNVVFGQNVALRHPHKIRVGNNVVIDDNCLLDAKGETNRGIRLGDGVFIGRNTILSCKNGDIDLGDGANVGFNCELFSASRVTVGRSVLMAAYTYVIGGDHDFSDPAKAVIEQRRHDRRRRVDWRGREDSRRRHHRSACGHRRRCRRSRRRSGGRDRRRHPRARRRVARRTCVVRVVTRRKTVYTEGIYNLIEVVR